MAHEERRLQKSYLDRIESKNLEHIAAEERQEFDHQRRTEQLQQRSRAAASWYKEAQAAEPMEDNIDTEAAEALQKQVNAYEEGQEYIERQAQDFDESFAAQGAKQEQTQEDAYMADFDGDFDHEYRQRDGDDFGR